MATLHSFRAWRPAAKDIQKIACVPYDVVSPTEARALAEGNPQSFLHVIRPEIDLPTETAFNDPEVYKKGSENLQRFMQKHLLEEDEDEALYLYQLEWDGKLQTGLFGCVSVDDYNQNVILKHELTRPDKEDDRTRHIIEQRAHAEPVMITYKDDSEIEARTRSICTKKKPLYDFTASDGVTHRIWKIIETAPWEDLFAQIPHLYIADGHHRCKSASRAAEVMQKENNNHTGNEEYNFFPAVLFPMSEMNILAYNRLVHHIPDNFKGILGEHFDVVATNNPAPSNKGAICLYMNGSWSKITLPEVKNPSPVEKLDAHRLQQFLLEPLLGIKDIRRDENISFVGGSRGTQALEHAVNSGEAELAISMFPTAINELVEVSNAGLLMPPKSTWFEPKLRSGLLIHTF